MKIKLKVLFAPLVAIVLLADISMAQAQTGAAEKKATLEKQVDEAVNNAIAENKIPGAVVQIKKDGQVVYLQAYGDAEKYDYIHLVLAQLDKMSTNTLFDLASLTKV